MAKPVIVSQDTVSALLEANAALAAWYYQLAGALQRAGVGVEPPSAEQRLAHLQQLAAQWPELAVVAREISAPRPYVPTPVVAAPAAAVENADVVVPPPPPAAAPAGPAPPPMVDAGKVRWG